METRPCRRALRQDPHHDFADLHLSYVLVKMHQKSNLPRSTAARCQRRTILQRACIGLVSSYFPYLLVAPPLCGVSPRSLHFEHRSKLCLDLGYDVIQLCGDNIACTPLRGDVQRGDGFSFIFPLPFDHTLNLQASASCQDPIGTTATPRCNNVPTTASTSIIAKPRVYTLASRMF